MSTWCESFVKLEQIALYYLHIDTKWQIRKGIYIWPDNRHYIVQRNRHKTICRRS